MTVLLLRILLECLYDFLKKLGLVLFPKFIGKYFYFIKSFEPRCFHPGSYFFDRDATFSHETAVPQKISCGHIPIANVKCEQVPMVSASLYFLFQIRVPPKVININGNTNG